MQALRLGVGPKTLVSAAVRELRSASASLYNTALTNGRRQRNAPLLHTTVTAASASGAPPSAAGPAPGRQQSAGGVRQQRPSPEQYRSKREDGKQRPAKLQDEQQQPHEQPVQGEALSLLPRVVLKGGKSKLFSQLQSPMVYSGAIDRVVGKPAPKAGDAVLVCDGSETPIGWGVFNPASMFRVRMMQTVDEVFGGAALLQCPDLHSLVGARIQQAVALRRALGLRCGPAALEAADAQEQGVATTVFRLINSEGDRLSGLIVDVLGEHLVVASSAAWVEKHRESISAWLQQHTGLSSVVWRPALDMLREEGCELVAAGHTEAAADGADEAGGGAAAPSSSSSSSEAGSEAGVAAEAALFTTAVAENGIHYLAAPHGQKTGFYADQRDNRVAVRQLADGLRVLDLCCYSGGFALSAAAGGAAEVLGVDSSAAAVELAVHNAALNAIVDVCSFERANVADFMKQALAERRRWDLVVFDPPKLAPSRRTLDKATRKYRRLNGLAMQLVEPGGLLMTCSCSGAMSQSGEFIPMLQAAARDVGRRVTVLRVAGAGPDHNLDPAYPEGHYLTNVLLRIL